MMGDLIIVFVKFPSIPVQGVLGDYIDRCINSEFSLPGLIENKTTGYSYCSRCSGMALHCTRMAFLTKKG